MTKESLRFGSRTPRNRSHLLFAVVLLLSIPFLATKISAQEKPKIPPFTPDPKLAEIIREVQKNEVLYENLETEQRKVKELIMKDNSAGWSVTRRDEKLHTVRQGGLLYYRGDKKELYLSGDVVNHERVSAFDGEQTRTVDYGSCANIHAGRYESQDVYPPHCWALFDQRVNFPLSVLLQGTRAIHAHPKVHRYDREKGTVYEFNRFEAEYVGEEEVNGLNCVKILCRRWYYTIRNGKPRESFIWLAPERNYLCVKHQPIPPNAKNPPYSLTIVDSFREIADGIWLPERVRNLDYNYDDVQEGNQTIEWKDTLELVEAKLNPERPVSFFSEIEIPEDLPVYHIVDGHLADQKFHDLQPTADSEERVREIIDKIRAEEQKYKNLEVVAEETYRKPDVGIVGTRQGAETMLRKTSEHSIQKDGKLWYLTESSSKGVDGSVYESRSEDAYDGEWTRWFHHSSSTEGETIRVSQYARLQRENGSSVTVHVPHSFCLRNSWEQQKFSEYLSSPWSSVRYRTPHRIEYLGEDERDGVRCVVLREVNLNRETQEVRSESLMWLAVDRNYLPFRYEWYGNPQHLELPEVIMTTDEWRELAPGLWFPFRVTRFKFEDWHQENLWIGRMLIQHVTTLNVSKAVIDPDVDDELFKGPEVPAGAKVSFCSKTGIYLANFEQVTAGRLELSEEEYVNLLNATNDRLRADERRKKAMDALIGKPASEIPASKWLNGTPQTWGDLKGKVVVLNFWADWCRACRPDLEQLVKHYNLQDDESKAELAIIGVHAAGSKLADIEKVIQKYKVKYPVFVDPLPKDDGWGELFNAFEVHAMPQAFVIDADGKIAARGQLKEMLAKAEQLVNQERQRGDEKPNE